MSVGAPEGRLLSYKRKTQSRKIRDTSQAPMLFIEAKEKHIKTRRF